MASIHDADNDSMFGKNLSVYSSTPEPADGEVAELVERLQWIADEFAQGSELKGSGYASDIQAVIKHILHPQPAAVPVPASERLPGAEDCDEQGRCWMSTTATDPGWVLDYPERCTNWSHWLPANALPIPETNND